MWMYLSIYLSVDFPINQYIHLSLFMSLYRFFRPSFLPSLMPLLIKQNSRTKKSSAHPPAYRFFFSFVYGVGVFALVATEFWEGTWFSHLCSIYLYKYEHFKCVWGSEKNSRFSIQVEIRRKKEVKMPTLEFNWIFSF